MNVVQYREKDEVEWTDMKYPPSMDKDHLCLLASRWKFCVRELYVTSNSVFENWRYCG